jgi:hypothetical protein
VANFNLVDAIIESFLWYELGYYQSNGLRLLADKPKYTTELDFNTAFIDDEQIFRESFDTIYQGENSRDLSEWVAMAWNREAIVPNVTRRNQRWTRVRYGEGNQFLSMRIVDDDLFICLFANTFNILALAEQRNIVDRGHDVPVELEINNVYLAKVVINASYPWQHEFRKLPKEEYGGIVSLKYAVKLSFPVLSATPKDFNVRKLVIKLGIGNEIIRTWEIPE